MLNVVYSGIGGDRFAVHCVLYAVTRSVHFQRRKTVEDVRVYFLRLSAIIQTTT